MQGRLFTGTFWSASYEPLHRLAVFERSTAPVVDLGLVDDEVAALAAALEPVERRRAAALIDLRAAPLDPRADADALWARHRLAFAGYRRYALVVRTAVGKLQISRLARATAAPAGVFFDPAEARLFCRQTAAPPA
ncbi:MAG TPA: hypothetical protein VFS43_00080 [Polyangiaceae bacterium]|nr:hypothetical protein [Polyangiaceae bacterium]